MLSMKSRDNNNMVIEFECCSDRKALRVMEELCSENVSSMKSKIKRAVDELE